MYIGSLNFDFKPKSNTNVLHNSLDSIDGPCDRVALLAGEEEELQAVTAMVIAILDASVRVHGTAAEGKFDGKSLTDRKLLQNADAYTFATDIRASAH
jgi:hypothetical protein